MSLPTSQMRIALLVNSSPTSPLASQISSSWKRALKSIEPTCKIDIFDTVIAQEYPDQFDYDLIILSGGATDPRSDEPWVQRMREFIREVAADQTTKLLGICWGHQIVAQALGGRVETMEEGPIGDISTVKLTPEGQAFLGFPARRTSFQAPEFHVRYVAEAVDGFIPLADNHQAFLGNAGQIFTFQVHPEMDDLMVNAVLDSTDVYTPNKTEAEIQELRKKPIGGDGLFILSRMIQWVYDHN